MTGKTNARLVLAAMEMVIGLSVEELADADERGMTPRQYKDWQEQQLARAASDANETMGEG